MTKNILSMFDHSLKEAKIANCRTAAVLGTDPLAQSLANYLSGNGLQFVGFLTQERQECVRTMSGSVVWPLNELGRISPSPDAIAVASIDRPRFIKDLIYHVPGPMYKGVVITVPCDKDDGCYAGKYTPVPEIAALRDIHAGQRAFVIGNGPSLRKTDPRCLKGEITFGCNALFLLPDFQPTYYFVEDVLVAEDRSQTINALPWKKFFPGDLKRFLTSGIFFNANRVQWINLFSTDFALGIEMNATVTYTMLQAAFYFGCNPVYLIGIDHNYIVNNSEIERKNTVFTSKTDDRNHFHPDYFGKGLRWHDPRVDRMEAAYRLARRAYEEDGRKILNATAEGRLEVFERVSFDKIVKHVRKSCQVFQHAESEKSETAPDSQSKAAGPNARQHGIKIHTEPIVSREAELIARLVCARFQYFRILYPVIALYGAGAHTMWLLDLLENSGLFPDKMSKIYAILDDKPDGHSGLKGIKVLTISPSALKGIDALVLSTDCHQDAMKSRLSGMTGAPQIPIIDIYEDLPGPFSKQYSQNSKIANR